MNILACDLSDMGFEILPVKVRFNQDTPYGREITVPYYFQEPQRASLSTIRKTLGLDLSREECVKALARMGVYAVSDEDYVYIECPEYRNDFLHEVDVAEDVMIGHGLNLFTPVMPTDFTVGRLSPVEEFSRKVKDIMTGLGFQEMMYNYLGSRREYIDNMHISDEKAVFIANPMSENYEVIRPSILPCLLESESVSGHAVYPHLIFECGKVTVKDESDNSGTHTGNSVGFFASDLQMGYRKSCILPMEYIVTEVELVLTPGEKESIRARMDELMARRKEKQPLEFPSAGSTFKRPEGYFAGKLIMDAGLRGFCVGGACVSEKHCGFVVNKGGATAADILELCRRIKGIVREKFGVTLEMEVRLLGDFLDNTV